VSGDQAPASVAPRTWFKETLNAASIYTFTPVFVAESESAVNQKHHSMASKTSQHGSFSICQICIDNAAFSWYRKKE